MTSERLFSKLSLGMAGLLALLTGPAWAASFAEAEVRASFLYNFAKYTDWPDTGKGSLNICTLNDPELARALKNLDGKPVGPKRLVTADLSSLASIRECQIVHIGDTEMYRLDKIMQSVGSAPVLTVSSAAALDQVAVVLTLDQQRMVFDINLDAYRRAGLQPQSTMLRLARQVKKSP